MGNVRRKPTKSGPPKRKDKLSATASTTLALFQSGMTMEYIASERDLTANTVQNHLAEAIQRGKLEIDGIVSAEDVANIRKALVIHGHSGLKMVRDSLNQRYTYADLKMVAAHLEFEGKSKSS